MLNRQKSYKRMQQLMNMNQDEMINLVLDLEQKLESQDKKINQCEARLFSYQNPSSLINEASTDPDASALSSTNYRRLSQENK